MKNFLILMAIILFVLPPRMATASPSFRYNPQALVHGKVRRYTVRDGESLYELARKYHTGYNKIIAANPGVDPYVPGRGTKLIIPTAWFLPDATPARGIVINISEMRLYYFFRMKGVTMVRAYPIGIGDEGADTPIGSFRVIEKILHPAWHVPASIRKERPELPPVVPPGPDNPMGDYALRLSLGTVLIHGTDVPWGIGRRVSHGCIRLYPEDIKELYHLVPINTPVTIIRQPVKVGKSHGAVYVEVNEDPVQKHYDYRGIAMGLLKRKGLISLVAMDKVDKAIKEKKGFPVDVSLKKRQRGR